MTAFHDPRRAGNGLATLFVLLGFAFAPAFAAATDGAALPAADVVDAEGRLHLPEGYAGAIDIAGFTLATDADGAPRLVPEATTEPLPTGFSFGQIRHGCLGRTVNTVRTAIRMPNGDLVLGGDFTTCGDKASAQVVRWDGARWNVMGVTQTGTSYGGRGTFAMALMGSDLHVLGATIFYHRNPTWLEPLTDMARWDGTNWQRAICPYCNVYDDQYIKTVAVVGDKVYVGGYFNRLYGDIDQPVISRALNIALAEGGYWHPILECSNGYGIGPNGPVMAMAVSGGDLYVGGDFTSVSDCGFTVPAHHVARWDGAHWSALGSDESNGVDGAVHALVYASGSLYVGGLFGAAGSTTASSVARWDGTAWHALGNGIFGEVDALAFHDGQLYAGGDFRSTGNGPALRVARFSQGTWSAMGQGLGAQDNSNSSRVNAIVADAFGIAAFGDFTQAPNMPEANHMAKWTGTAWAPFSGVSETTQVEGRVNAIAVRGKDLFVGGAITQVGETPVHNLARWNGTAWSALGAAGNEGVDAEVFSLATTAGNVYVGGDFTHAGNQFAAHVARWDGAAWHALGQGTDDRVIALAANDDASVYAAGPFTHAHDTFVNGIARWNGTTWLPLVGAGNGIGLCGSVYALAPAGNEGVYVGGNFPNPPCGNSSDPGHALVMWDGSRWNQVSEILQPGEPMAYGTSTITRLVRDGDVLYAGGDITSFAYYYAGDLSPTFLPIPCVVGYNTSAQTWKFFDMAGFAGCDRARSTFAIAGVKDKLYLAADDLLQEYTNGSGWRKVAKRLGGGYNDGADAAGVIGDRLYLGGAFIGYGNPDGYDYPRYPSQALIGFVGDSIFKNGFDRG